MVQEQLQNQSYKGPDVVRFLQGLLRKLPGKLLIIWDGASIHRSCVVKQFLAQGGAKRIHLECLPGYAPELNPQEGVWNLLKRRERKAPFVLTISGNLPSNWCALRSGSDIAKPFFVSASLMLASLFRLLW
jgi:transposase